MIISHAILIKREIGRWQKITHHLDVDGTLTDGGIYYDEMEMKLKKFCYRCDWFFLQHQADTKMILTGRECFATQRRICQITWSYFQNIAYKEEYLVEFIEKMGISKENIIYIGDDLNDYAAMQHVGYIGCPENSCREIKDIANYVSHRRGGEGAVRDIIEHFLRQDGSWEHAVKKVYNIGI